MKFNYHLVLQILLLLFFGYSIVSALDWPESARNYAWLFSMPGFALVSITFVKTFITKTSVEEIQFYMDKKVLVFFAWLIGLILFIWLIGFKAALIIYCFVYLKFEGKRPLWICLTFAGVTYFLVFVVIEFLVGSAWPRGFLPDMFGFTL